MVFPLVYLVRWKTIFDGCNLPNIEEADFISRWMVISRACVLSMTFTSGVLGILLALEHGSINVWYALLSLTGILAAHVSNNLINDWTDSKMGVDTEDYPRAQYSVHPLLGGLTTPVRLLIAAFLFLVVDAAIMITLILLRGWPIAVFAVSGLFLSLLYTVILKRIALGELSSLIVWGPLMIGGTAYAASGAVGWPLIIASIPYGLIVASVLVGKHMDKLDADRNAGVRTLPVLLGIRGSAVVLKVSAVAFYILIVVLVVFRMSGPWILVSVLALVRLRKAWKIFGKPKPEAPPEDWPIWPLWYVGWAMYFNRQAGLYLIIGLILNLVISKIIALFV